MESDTDFPERGLAGANRFPSTTDRVSTARVTWLDAARSDSVTDVPGID